MTADVESFSIPLNKCDLNTAREVCEIGLPRLLELLSKHDVQGTFYFTGEIVEAFPESVEIVVEDGHEIGCHGYDHSPEKAFDSLSYEEQVKELIKARETIESIAGKIESFRAPMLRINKDTVKALEKTGFKSDSSVAPQRFDGPFTFGSKRKLKWLIAPRRPYYLSYSSPIKRGRSSVLEVPISALIVPYIGTAMRISPILFKIIQKILFIESKVTDKPIVFLFHPNECLDVHQIATTRRASNLPEYLFADILRQKMKLRNLGVQSLKLLDEVLSIAKKHDFEFIRMKKYRKIYRRMTKNGNSRSHEER